MYYNIINTEFNIKHPIMYHITTPSVISTSTNDIYTIYLNIHKAYPVNNSPIDKGIVSIIRVYIHVCKKLRILPVCDLKSSSSARYYHHLFIQSARVCFK